MTLFSTFCWIWWGIAQSEAVPTTSTALTQGAQALENPSVRYVSNYVSIPYPMGDVPADTGVCTDVVIRAYRAVGIDLQQLLHEDIIANPNRYPNIKRPDSNIDHRRVPNLGTFFKHQGTALAITNNANDYQPGDVVWWKLGSPTGLNHIGIVIDQTSADDTPLVIHNIGNGQVVENILFNHHIVGHYRYFGS